MAEPTVYEQYMLELVNRTRANPTAEATRLGIDLNQGLTAGTISTAAKQPLAFNTKLIDSARAHSTWMLDTDTFSHTGINGSNPGARMTDAGYVFSGQWTWGENLAITWGSGIGITQAVVNQMEDGLFRSPGHRVNLLGDNFREIGVGIALGEYKGSPGVTATQNFAKSGTLPFLTGVAYTDRDGDRLYDPGEGMGGIAVEARSSSGALYKTTTWTAGGYQLQLPADTYTVTFSGGGLAAPTTKTATIQGQNVKVDLLKDTTTPAPVTTTSATKIVVNAHGTVAGGVNAKFNLLVDGVKVGEGTAGTTAKDYVFSANVAADKAHQVQVQYTNDGVVNGQDRNLFVNKVTINAKAVAPTDSIVTYDRGALDGKDVIAGQSSMWWGGTLVVKAPSTYFPATTVAAKAAALDAHEFLAANATAPEAPAAHAEAFVDTVATTHSMDAYIDPALALHHDMAA